MIRRRDPRLQTLSAMDVLSGTRLRDLEMVCGLTTEVTLAAGTVLCRQGAAAQEVFLVADGEVAVSLDDVPLGVIARGGMVGEMGLLNAAPRRATATALTEVTVLVLSGGEFAQLLGKLPNVAANVRTLSAQRTEELTSKAA